MSAYENARVRCFVLVVRLSLMVLLYDMRQDFPDHTVLPNQAHPAAPHGLFGPVAEQGPREPDTVIGT